MKLPEGYTLKYGKEVVFLYDAWDEIVAFSDIGATEESIEKEAWDHYSRRMHKKITELKEPEGRVKDNED